MTELIEVFKQNSIRIKSDKGVIYVDPFHIDGSYKDASFVMITHDHYDHFSPEDIEKVAGENAILIVPEKMMGKAEKISGMFKDVIAVNPGGSYEAGGLEFETVASYNTLKPFHPKSAGWVGYILIIDGKRIYIAGDTDATKEAKAVRCDIALVPIGGTYTMDSKKAADFINEIKPSVAIPVHYGEFVGSPKDGEVFSENVNEPVKVEFKIQF